MALVRITKATSRQALGISHLFLYFIFLGMVNIFSLLGNKLGFSNFSLSFLSPEMNIVLISNAMVLHIFMTQFPGSQNFKPMPPQLQLQAQDDPERFC
jgi:hypothetical protein